MPMDASLACWALFLYYLGNKYSSKIWKTPFMVCKSTKYIWPWVLIFGIAFLSLHYCSYPSGHPFVKEIEVMLGLTSSAIFSVLQTFSKSIYWFHLIRASELVRALRLHSNWRSWKVDSETHIVFNVSSRFWGLILFVRSLYTGYNSKRIFFCQIHFGQVVFLWSPFLNGLSYKVAVALDCKIIQSRLRISRNLISFIEILSSYG